jgi:hypothetical protein
MVVVVINVKMVNKLTTPLLPKLIATTMVAPTIATIVAISNCFFTCVGLRVLRITVGVG